VTLSADLPPPAPRRGFWQRRVRDPLIALLKQGTTPDALARTLAWGGVCGLLPFLGLTTTLTLAVGQWRKLNHALMQGVNYLLTPVQLAMILIYMRLGELIWGVTGERFTVAELVRSFGELSIGEFLRRFGWAGVHAFTAWALTAPLLFFAIYLLTRPALHRLARLWT
jgi:uncharacterized protein (DUF2062 family)